MKFICLSGCGFIRMDAKPEMSAALIGLALGETVVRTSEPEYWPRVGLDDKPRRAGRWFCWAAFADEQTPQMVGVVGRRHVRTPQMPHWATNGIIYIPEPRARWPFARLFSQ